MHSEAVAIIDGLSDGMTQYEWWRFLDQVIRELEVRKQGAATMLIAAGYTPIYEGWSEPEVRADG